MEYKIKIISKAGQAKPSVFLFFRNDEKPFHFFKTAGISPDFNDFIGEQLKRKNYFFRLPEKGEPVFIQVIERDEKEEEYKTLEKLRVAGSRFQREIKRLQLINVTLSFPGFEKWLLPYLEGILLSDYQFIKYKTKQEKSTLKGINLVVPPSFKKELLVTEAVVESVFIARDLVNEPGSFLPAIRLSEEIKNLGNKYGFRTEIFHKQKIGSLKMGGLLAVNSGSLDPPTFSILEWKPRKAINDKPIVFVGKGIVFDTGGLSLKPTFDSMDHMKSDMAGAAVVTGTIAAISMLNLPVHVIGLIPATDNRPGERAYLPGDVVTMYNGTTVEVLNTDAEGRLILADALGYAGKFDPELVIDVATLTGAASSAIGRYGMVGFDKAGGDTFNKLVQSGFATHERVVEFPLWDDYAELIESDVADIKNVGGSSAGAITAAKFLEKFISYPWIHLDIAGVSYDKKGHDYVPQGGSGTGIRLLVHFLIRKFINP